MHFIDLLKKKIDKTILRTPGIEKLKFSKPNFDKKKYIKFWLNSCKKNPSLNYFFFQNNQILKKNFIFEALDKPIITNNMFESLSHYGIIQIENVLPPNELDDVKSYFKDLENLNDQKKWKKKPFKVSERKDTELKIGSIDLNIFQTLKSYSDLASQRILNKIVEPNVDLHYLKIINESEEAIRGETYLHTDRFLPHFKMFYTPFEITIDDAPFEYALGSHKINSNYKNFFQYAKNFDETDDLSNKIIKEKVKIITKPNTLYIAFTNGFHRRSDFKSKSTRHMVFFQYVERFNKINYLFG